MSIPDHGLTSFVDHVTLPTRRRVKVGRDKCTHWLVYNRGDVPVEIEGKLLYKDMIRSVDKLPVVSPYNKGAVLTVTSYKKIKGKKV